MKYLFLIVPMISLLGGCGFFGGEEVAELAPQATQVVGEITSVHSEQGFVLFRRYGPGQLLTDGILSARSLNGKRGVHLELSPETLGRFYVADYSKESEPPRQGDVVVLTKIRNDRQTDEL